MITSAYPRAKKDLNVLLKFLTLHTSLHRFFSALCLRRTTDRHLRPMDARRPALALRLQFEHRARSVDSGCHLLSAADHLDSIIACSARTSAHAIRCHDSRTAGEGRKRQG